MRKMSNPRTRKMRVQGFEEKQKRNVKQYIFILANIFSPVNRTYVHSVPPLRAAK